MIPCLKPVKYELNLQGNKSARTAKDTTELSSLTDISMEQLKAFQKANPKIWKGSPDGQFFEKEVAV